MFPNLDSKSAQQITWEQRLLKNSGRSKALLKPEYQELKFTLHRKLVDKINLEALATIDNQRVRSEVRQALISLIDSEPTLLSSLEKQQISDEVLDEVFGLSSRAIASGSDYLRHSCQHAQTGLRRTQGLLELTSVTFRDDSHLLRIIDKIVSQSGGAWTNRRHGGCPLERWFPRKCHHPTVGRGWSAAVHPPLQHRQTDAQRPGGPPGHDSGHDGVARSGP